MEKRGALAPQDMAKALMQLAYTGCSTDLSWGIRCLARLPSDYFTTTFLEQVQADADFASLVVDFWKMLARVGIMSPEITNVNMTGVGEC